MFNGLICFFMSNCVRCYPMEKRVSLRVSKALVSITGSIPAHMPLTDTKIRNTKPAEKPIKLTDGGGLYLEVRPTGTKLWRYRYRIAGKENIFAIGEYPTVSLADARGIRVDARELVKRGIHPVHERNTSKAAQISNPSPRAWRLGCPVGLENRPKEAGRGNGKIFRSRIPEFLHIRRKPCPTCA